MTIETTHSYKGYGIVEHDDGEISVVTLNGDFIDSGFNSVYDAIDFIDLVEG